MRVVSADGSFLFFDDTSDTGHILSNQAILPAPDAEARAIYQYQILWQRACDMCASLVVPGAIAGAITIFAVAMAAAALGRQRS